MIQAASQFLQQVAEETKLQEELAKAVEAENDRQAVVELGAKYGYQFNGNELMAEIEKRQKAAIESGELTEEQLEAVAGGATPIAVSISVAVSVTITVTGTVAENAKW